MALKAVLGSYLPDDLAAGIEQDQRQAAVMPLLITPQMINTMQERDLWNDPVRRYMLPAIQDRHPQWPSHPLAQRDSLHETEMWAIESLTRRYPTKVMAELLSSCPVYCGHCTRMDLVGGSTPLVNKRVFRLPLRRRLEGILRYLRENSSVRDVTVSGGDIVNLAPARLEDFIGALMDIASIRDIRLDSKALIALPQHFFQKEVIHSLGRLARKARKRRISLAWHTHINHANQITPLVARAARQLLDMGFRDVRSQGVLLRGVNATAKELLELCFTMLDQAQIIPYYFYMCEMIPGCEHWRVSIHEAQRLQHDIMGYLPGFATPRIVCDVPLLGKRWVSQCREYDRERGISYWTKNYRTPIEGDDPQALTRRYAYYDPLHTLPAQGQRYWLKRTAGSV